jgi:hypothetical protein
MRDDLQAQLYADFPHLFWQASLSKEQSGMHWGLCISDGWEPILRRLCERLTSILVNDMALDLASPEARRYAFSCVKQKLGSLRIYMSEHTPAMMNAVDYAEDEANCTCERCGASGNLMEKPSGYLITLCRDCADDSMKPVTMEI